MVLARTPEGEAVGMALVSRKECRVIMLRKRMTSIAGDGESDETVLFQLLYVAGRTGSLCE